MANKKGTKHYKPEFKEEVVDYLVNTSSFVLAKQKYLVSDTSLRKWLLADERYKNITMARKIGSYNYSFEFKLEVLNDLFTSSDSNVMIAKKYKIHPKTVSSWLKKYMINIELLKRNSGKHSNHDSLIDIYDIDLSNLNDLEWKIYIDRLQNNSKQWSNIEKYRYINMIGQKATQLFNILSVTSSAYYRWRRNKPKMNAYKPDIEKLVIDAFTTIPLGYRRLTMLINRQNNSSISVHQVRRYMKVNSLKGISNKKSKPRYRIQKNYMQDANLINQNFRAKQRNEKWYMDYTYVPVNNGHNYVMFIMDGYNKEVINTKVVSSRKDSVTKATISKAICSRNISKGTNLIIHSDQGVEFNNTQVKRYLKNKKIKQSFSKAGTPLDNALMESLISSFKREYNISDKKISSTKELIKLVNSWTDTYNNVIPQKVLGALPPCKFP